MADGVELYRDDPTMKLKIKRLGVERKDRYRRLPIGTLADLVVYSGFMNSQFDRNITTPNLERLRKLRYTALKELSERITATFKKATDEGRVERKLRHYLRELKRRFLLIDTLPNTNKGEAMKEAFLFLADYKAVHVRQKSSTKKAKVETTDKSEPGEDMVFNGEQFDEMEYDTEQFEDLINTSEPPEEIEVQPEPCEIS